MSEKIKTKSFELAAYIRGNRHAKKLVIVLQVWIILEATLGGNRKNISKYRSANAMAYAAPVHLPKFIITPFMAKFPFNFLLLQQMQ